jgi:chromosome segregation ATPase
MGNRMSEEASDAMAEEKQQTIDASKQQEEIISNLEKRAIDAERKLDSLEKRVESLSGTANEGNQSGLTARYVAELKGLRGTLVEATREHEALVEHVAELEKAKAKLEYQILHLKRSLQSS